MAGSRTDTRRARREQAKLARRRELRRRARARGIRGAAVAVALAVVLGGLGFVVLRGGSGGVSFGGDFRAGGTLEDLRIPALEGGGTLDYTQFEDRPLVINFFASWCPFCVGEMPAFQRVHERLGDEEGFLGISQSDSRNASIDLAHQTGITYPAGIDAQGAFFNAVGTNGMPTTLFVLPGGRIAYVQVGPLDEETLTQAIGRYLGVSA